MITVKEAERRQGDYTARPEVKATLGTITLLAFVGPTGAGKNYLMNHLPYHQVGNAVTRAPRPDDPAGYRYTDNNEMLGLIEERRLVQYNASAARGTIYGTALEDYAANGVNSMAVFSDSIDALRQRCGFGIVRTAFVVAQPETWRDRLDHRFDGMRDAEIASRLDEAESSLVWGLSEDGPDTMHVDNDVIDTNVTLKRIRRFANAGQRNEHSNKLARQTAEAMLSALPGLRNRYL